MDKYEDVAKQVALEEDDDFEEFETKGKLGSATHKKKKKNIGLCLRTAYIVPDPDHGPERELRDLPARVGPAASTKANEERTLFPPACRQPATRNGPLYGSRSGRVERRRGEPRGRRAVGRRLGRRRRHRRLCSAAGEKTFASRPSFLSVFFFFAAELTPPPPSRSRCSVLAEDGAGEGRQGAQQVRVRLPCTIKPHTPAAAVDSQKHKQRRGKPFLYSYTRPRGLPRPPSFLSSLHSRSVPQVSLLLA